MSDYTYNGVTYSQDDIELKADGLGITVDQYLNKYQDIKPVNEGKTEGSTQQNPNVESENTGFTLDDGSSESVDISFPHITTEQIDEGSWHSSEKDLVKKLNTIYGDDFEITEAKAGSDAFTMKHKKNGKETTINMDKVGAMGFNKDSSAIQSEIQSFVESTKQEDKAAEGDYSKRLDIREKTGGSISTDQTVPFIDLTSSEGTGERGMAFSERERFDTRKGKFSDFTPIASFMSGGYNPDQTDADTKMLDKITSDISMYTKRFLNEFDEAQQGKEYNVTQDQKEEIKEKVFEAINDRVGSGYLLPRDSFDTLFGGEGMLFIEKEIQEKANTYRKNNKISNLDSENVDTDVRSDIFKGFYEQQDEAVQIKHDIVQERIPLETRQREIEDQLRVETDPDKLKGLEQEKKANQLKITDLNNRIKKNADDNSNWLFGKSEAELSSMFMEQGYTHTRAKNIAKAMKMQPTEMDMEMESIKAEFPNLTDREHLTKYLDKLVVNHQNIIKDGSSEMIELNLGKMSATDVDDELINHLKANGGITETLDGGLGYAEISLADALKFGIDVRDFRGGLDETLGRDEAISSEDLAKLETYEAARDHNHGLMAATWELVHLDRDPKAIVAGTGGAKGAIENTGVFLQQIVNEGSKAVATKWFDASERQADQVLSASGKVYSDRKMLDNMNAAASDFNEENRAAIEKGEMEAIVFDDEQLESIKRTFADGVAEGVGQFVPTLIELAAITAATKGLGTIPAVARYVQTLKRAKDVGGFWGKAKYHTAAIALEEAKMQVAGFKPGSGAAFYVGGALTPWFRPGAMSAGLKGFDPLFSKTVKAGVVGAASGEFALITELAIEDVMGEREFGAEMKHLFGDMDEVEQRFMTNALVFGMAGQMGKGRLKTGLRSGIGDFHVTAGAKKRALGKIRTKQEELLYSEKDRAELKEIDKQQEQNRKDYRNGKKTKEQHDLDGKLLAENKKLIVETNSQRIENRGIDKILNEMSNKDKKRYDTLDKAFQDGVMLFTAQANNAKLDPTSKNFNANYRNMVVEPINQIMKKINGKNHKNFDVQFITNKEAGAYFQNKGSVAEFRPDLNKIFVNKDYLKQRYSSGELGAVSAVSNHELVHMALRQVFKSNKQMDVNFTTRLDKVFKAAYNGKGLAEVMGEVGKGVKKEYKVGEKEGQTEQQRREKEFQLRQEEYLSNLAEFMTNPDIYYSQINNTFLKNAKIETTKFLEEMSPALAKKFAPKTAKGFIEFLGRLGDSARKGQRIAGKVSTLANLEDVSFLGIEYKAGLRTQALSKKAYDYTGQRQGIIENNKLLLNEFKNKKITRTEFEKRSKENNKKLQEINKNIQASKTNKELTDLYKNTNEKFEKTNSESDKLRRDRIFEDLRNNNEGILNKYIDGPYGFKNVEGSKVCLLYTSPSPRDS